jgi:hypothetical protein
MENQVLETREIRENEPAGTAELVQRANPDRMVSERAVSNGGHEPLFPESETESFRNRWHDIQGRFVDEPRQAVEQGDQLVASVIQRLAEVFANERSRMEHEWSQGQDVSTEDLRQALRRYRSFFDRLLSV